MTNQTSEERCTYFYVFVDNVRASQSDGDALKDVPPDLAVSLAFERLRSQYPNAIVVVNPSDGLRRSLGIESLPAFAVSDIELPLDGSVKTTPPKLPSVWNPLAIFERRKILNSGKYIPRAERNVISLYKTPEDLYQFVRDLHMKQIDEGLVEAAKKIESEVRKIGGRKVLNAAAVTKKIFLG